ncbi:hypothetical protein JB92DRAFT_2832098 [Gautieria morchelliformis]|nr:hypothetical protein JB92DRAFT_2832098 [Gautieria morchelliformis]
MPMTHAGSYSESSSRGIEREAPASDGQPGSAPAPKPERPGRTRSMDTSMDASMDPQTLNDKPREQFAEPLAVWTLKRNNVGKAYKDIYSVFIAVVSTYWSSYRMAGAQVADMGEQFVHIVLWFRNPFNVCHKTLGSLQHGRRGVNIFQNAGLRRLVVAGNELKADVYPTNSEHDVMGNDAVGFPSCLYEAIGYQVHGHIHRCVHGHHANGQVALPKARAWAQLAWARACQLPVISPLLMSPLIGPGSQCNPGPWAVHYPDFQCRPLGCHVTQQKMSFGYAVAFKH